MSEYLLKSSLDVGWVGWGSILDLGWGSNMIGFEELDQLVGVRFRVDVDEVTVANTLNDLEDGDAFADLLPRDLALSIGASGVKFAHPHTNRSVGDDRHVEEGHLLLA